MGGDSGELQCKGENADGTPCGAPPTMVDPDSGYCPAHDPDRADERRERAKAGGQATARKHRDGFSADELPPLESPADAERWMEILSRAMVAGRISRSKVDVARKGLKVWLSAHESGKLEAKFDRLVDGLESYRESGDPRDLMEVVDGELS